MTRVEPAAALVGDIAVPAVKGICQRGALLAAIADGESELRNFGHAADTDSALAAVAHQYEDSSSSLSSPRTISSSSTIRIEALGCVILRTPQVR